MWQHKRIKIPLLFSFSLDLQGFLKICCSIICYSVCKYTVYSTCISNLFLCSLLGILWVFDIYIFYSDMCILHDFLHYLKFFDPMFNPSSNTKSTFLLHPARTWYICCLISFLYASLASISPILTWLCGSVCLWLHVKPTFNLYAKGKQELFSSANFNVAFY